MSRLTIQEQRQINSSNSKMSITHTIYTIQLSLVFHLLISWYQLEIGLQCKYFFLYLLLNGSRSQFKEFIIKATSEAFRILFYIFNLFTNLPPIWIFPVYNLKDFSFRKFQTCFFAWDEVVVIWIIIKMTLHKNLKCVKIYKA